jgi:hypothetical protein
MTLLDRYQEALRNIPPPGCGCHPYLLAISNYGVMSGRDAEQFFKDVRSAIPMGTRRISDKEVTDAVNKALAEHGKGSFIPRPRPKPRVIDGKAALQRIIDKAKIATEDDLWEASPIRLWEEPQSDAILILETLWEPDDLLWMGDRHQAGIIGDTIRTARDWIAYLQNNGKTAPHIILNPLTGSPAMKKTGEGETYRGDGNVSSYHKAMAEFDGLCREDQIRFWSTVKLPIVALIDSGGKSIHAWLDVQKLSQVVTAEDWQQQIKIRLYDQILTPLGVDSACSNPSRLSRLPGHHREEKQAWQRLLWLSSDGRPIT